ncbi:hypothetical protein [Bradyrhizobium vignae]|uniref:hypothetical protein n=1 Tax=Bradyrhizobium vignae TaxID=1549949 RepID=UPI00100BB660|nr:hypothetical protein [Bradyrhizobium vignae]RXG84334.1 hypothetical protein EAV90_37315 [Bradyrhizobium vignae]
MEGDASSIDVFDGGDHLIVQARLINTGEGFFAVALVPTFPTAWSNDGTTYTMQEASGITMCPVDSPTMAHACIGDPFTQSVTIGPGAYTALAPGRIAAMNFLMKRERGAGRGTDAVFSARFAIRMFSDLDEDAARGDSESFKRTRIQSVQFKKAAIVDMAVVRDKLTK